MYNFIEEQVSSSLHYSMSLNKSWKTVLIKVHGAFSANSETLLAAAVHFCCRVLRTLRKTTLTLVPTFLNCCPQAGGIDASNHGPIDSRTASSPEL